MEHPESRTASQIRTEIERAEKAIDAVWDAPPPASWDRHVETIRAKREALAALRRIQAAYEWDTVKAQITSGQSR